MGKHIAENRRAYDAAYRERKREERAAAAKAWREANPERVVAYFDAHRREHREERKAQSARYRQGDSGRAAGRRAYEAAKAKGQRAAVEAVRRAVAAGRLVQRPCHCGEVRVEAHHHRGYDQEFRLDVVWLCRPHHEDAHHA